MNGKKKMNDVKVKHSKLGLNPNKLTFPEFWSFSRTSELPCSGGKYLLTFMMNPVPLSNIGWFIHSIETI